MVKTKWTLGMLILHKRELLGLNQVDFAKKVGIAACRISEIERGKTIRPRPKTLMRISKALKVPMEELLEALK